MLVAYQNKLTKTSYLIEPDTNAAAECFHCACKLPWLDRSSSEGALISKLVVFVGGCGAGRLFLCRDNVVGFTAGTGFGGLVLLLSLESARMSKSWFEQESSLISSMFGGSIRCPISE